MTKHCVVFDLWNPMDQNGFKLSIKHFFREFSTKDLAMNQKRHWENTYIGKDITVNYFSCEW